MGQRDEVGKSERTEGDAVWMEYEETLRDGDGVEESWEKVVRLTWGEWAGKQKVVMV